MTPTDNANTTDIVTPMNRINRAWISSGVCRFSGCCRTDGGIDQVFRAGFGCFTNRGDTFGLFPIGRVLTGIAEIAIPATATQRQGQANHRQ
jgi:hypothetical protein